MYKVKPSNHTIHYKQILAVYATFMREKIQQSVFLFKTTIVQNRRRLKRRITILEGLYMLHIISYRKAIGKTSNCFLSIPTYSVYIFRQLHTRLV
jgi:hypothetical protein